MIVKTVFEAYLLLIKCCMCVIGLSDHVSGIDKKVSVGNLSPIAVLASNKDVPLTNFTLELQHSLQPIGNTSDLSLILLQ